MKEHKYSATPHPWHYMQMSSHYILLARIQYSLDRSMGQFQNQSGHCTGQKPKNSLAQLGNEPQSSRPQLVIMLTQLYLLIFGNMKLTKMKSSTTPGRSTTAVQTTRTKHNKSHDEEKLILPQWSFLQVSSSTPCMNCSFPPCMP